MAQIKTRLTHPDKLLYPEDKITKLDLAEYYHSISDWILPYIVNRPITLVRCHANYKDTFYQKHIHHESGIFSIELSGKTQRQEYMYIKNQAGLLELIQLGTLEIHPWGSKIRKPEQPDMVIFDFDPAPDVTWKKVVKAVFEAKAYLAKIGLESFVRSTGGKGLHVVVPIVPKHDWAVIKEFAHSFVKYMVAQHPKQYIGEMSKAKRTGKIFIDYLRNGRGATAVASYSTRALPHATVATPLFWDELTGRKLDTTFTIKTVPSRLSGLPHDPWEEFFVIKQKIG